MSSHTTLTGTNEVAYSSSVPPTVGPGIAQINELHTNILPPELLSYIFTLGERAERFAQTKHNQDVRFQEIVSRVCSRWRGVAINTPTLWTWIMIKRPSHRQVAASYLIRAGSTALLDIEIEMRSGFWDCAEISPTDWASQLEYTSNLIEFLRAHDAGPGRWRTLSLWARQPEPLFKTLAFLHQHAAPALRCLSLKWASKDMQRVEETRAVNSARTSLRSLVLPPPAALNLRHVELTSVPWQFVLGRTSPLFTGLTNLSLTAATQLNSITTLTNLLRENPLLRSLHLSSGPNDMNAAYFSDYPLPCVSLPELHSFSVQSTYDSDWILDVLKVIRVPNLQKFTLATELYTDYPGEATGPELRLLNFLSGGNGDAYMDEHTSAASETKSIYPSLRELDISSVECYSGGKTIITLLSSFPSITRLSIANNQIDCLSRFPSVLPRLECLSLNGYPYAELGKILRRRAAAGVPIRMIELRGSYSWDPEDRDAYINALPIDVTVIDHTEPECDLGDESAAEDWEDEVDDDEEGGYFDTRDERTEGAEVNMEDDGLEDEDYDDYDSHDEEDEYGPSDGYEEADEYTEGINYPTCWIDEISGASITYDFDELGYFYDGTFGDSNFFVGEDYYGQEQGDEGYYEGDGWEGYDIDDSDGDGGEDLEGGGSDYGNYDDGYDYEDYGADD